MYNEIFDEYQKLNIKQKDQIITFVFSLIISVLIYLGPIALLINLLIYIHLKKLIVVLMAIIAIMFFYTINHLYFLGTAKGKIKGIYLLSIPQTILFSFVAFILVLILLLIGVV